MLQVIGATALLGGVLGGAGVVGIALGFAVRDTITNYVASMMLSLRQPFRANDHVLIEGNEGRVVRLTSRATILLTLDGNHIQIPNATVFSAIILNYSRNPQRRFEFDLGIDANDDPIAGMTTGLIAVNALVFVLDSPKATAVIRDIGDSNIVLRFYGWVDQTVTDFPTGGASPSRRPRVPWRMPVSHCRSRSTASASIKGPPLHRCLCRPARRGRRGGVRNTTTPDTRPDTHVATMVQQERAAGPQHDLLNEARPVE